MYHNIIYNLSLIKRYIKYVILKVMILFCDTSILFLKKLAVVKFSNEPGSEPLIAWKRANWVQETCLLIQSTVLRAASLYFHRGLRRCFTDDYELLFDSPVSRRLDNTVLGHSPPHIPAAG